MTHDKPAIVRTFISRQAEIDAFVKVLSGADTRRIVVVTGPPGSGKSALLAKYREICEERDAFVIRLEATASTPDPVDFVLQIRLAIGEPLTSIRTSEVDVAAITELLNTKLMEFTAERPIVVIVLDNFELVTKQQEEWFGRDFVTWLIEKAPVGIKVVVSGREIPFAIGFEDSVLHLELKPFSRAETEEYLKQLGLDLTAVPSELVNKLHEASKGNPVMLASLAESIKSNVNPGSVELA